MFAFVCYGKQQKKSQPAWRWKCTKRCVLQNQQFSKKPDPLSSCFEAEHRSENKSPQIQASLGSSFWVWEKENTAATALLGSTFFWSGKTDREKWEKSLEWSQTWRKEPFRDRHLVLLEWQMAIWKSQMTQLSASGVKEDDRLSDIYFFNLTENSKLTLKWGNCLQEEQ